MHCSVMEDAMSIIACRSVYRFDGEGSGVADFIVQSSN